MQSIGQLDLAIPFWSITAKLFDNANHIALGRHNNLESLVKTKVRLRILAYISCLQANNFN